jgi:hypothetical protein
LEPEKVHFATTPDQFGEVVARAFSRATDDIEEAAQCIAFDRSTACVFHLMRVLELGMYALADNLSVPNIQENWHNAIEQIEKAVRALPHGTPDEKTDQQFYSDVAAHLFNVKDAWRNRTAHAGHVYTESKAVQIFENTRSFMRTLSTRVAEKPL